jgi:hypothetical protein
VHPCVVRQRPSACLLGWLLGQACSAQVRHRDRSPRYGRGKDQHIIVPGWPYSFVVALEFGRSSWTAPLDAVRLAPGDDLAAVTAGQLRDVIGRLMADLGEDAPGF